MIVREPRCKKCSKPLENIEQEYCYDCSKRKFDYEKGYALWLYEGKCKDSILRFKYKHQRDYAKYYSSQLYENYYHEIEKLSIDAFVPIPIYKQKEMIRGYNQATLIADSLGKMCKIKVYSDVIFRKKETTPQKELSKKQRSRNLMNAFEINKKNFEKNIIQNNIKNIMIIDDIYTTGSTIEACSKLLKENGVKNIYFLCVCIGRDIGR